eukprot:2325085-Amphidinium_carterae.1
MAFIVFVTEDTHHSKKEYVHTLEKETDLDKRQGKEEKKDNDITKHCNVNKIEKEVKKKRVKKEGYPDDEIPEADFGDDDYTYEYYSSSSEGEVDTSAAVPTGVFRAYKVWLASICFLLSCCFSVFSSVCRFPLTSVNMMTAGVSVLSCASDSYGQIILDTACGSSCVGEAWLKKHRALLKHHGLKIKQHPSSMCFRFGGSKPEVSNLMACIPAGIGGRAIEIRAHVITGERGAQLPLLASLPLLKQLGCILDTEMEEASFRHLKL